MRARKTERFEATLATLSHHAEAQGFEVRGGFYAWERLKALVAELGRAYDYFELEGDVAPARRAIDAYQADLAHHGLRLDPWIAGQLGPLLAELEAPDAWVEVTLDVAPAMPADQAPSGMLAVSPEALQALLRARQTH